MAVVSLNRDERRELALLVQDLACPQGVRPGTLLQMKRAELDILEAAELGLLGEKRPALLRVLGITSPARRDG
jgi:hypothetical protein